MPESFISKGVRDAAKRQQGGKASTPMTGRVSPKAPTLGAKITPSTGLDNPRPRARITGMVGNPQDSPIWNSGEWGAPGGGGIGGAGGGGGEAIEPFLDPMANPAYLAALAGIDAEEGSTISGFRAKQDAARRSLADLLGDIADREVQARENALEAQETRGLLRSGATARLLADVAKAAGADRARGEQQVAEQVSDLERAIAEAQVAAERARGGARLQASGGKPVL